LADELPNAVRPDLLELEVTQPMPIDEFERKFLA
jgi:hypothetical protein